MHTSPVLYNATLWLSKLIRLPRFVKENIEWLRRQHPGPGHFKCLALGFTTLVSAVARTHTQFANWVTCACWQFIDNPIVQHSHTKQSERKYTEKEYENSTDWQVSVDQLDEASFSLSVWAQSFIKYFIKIDKFTTCWTWFKTDKTDQRVCGKKLKKKKKTDKSMRKFGDRTMNKIGNVFSAIKKKSQLMVQNIQTYE